tara:strand:- start:1731 stop:5390 length:3660 start_codon:yes stop_codon:yes gene_type:complete
MMRIAIDLQGIQSKGSRTRGIGRYSNNIIKSLIKKYTDNHYILVSNAALIDIRDDFSRELGYSNVHYFEWFSPTPLDFISNSRYLCDVAKSLRTYAFNRLDPDIIIITSLLEGFSDNAYTCIEFNDISCPVVSIFYDLIPLLNRDLYLSRNKIFEEFYLSKLNDFKRLDGIFAISNSSANEAITHLKINPSKVFNISSGCDINIFNLSKDESLSERINNINSKFILYTGAGDPRKNLYTLLKAYSKLKWNLYQNYTLVIAGKLLELEIQKLNEWIDLFNIESEQIILLGYVSDKELVTLYKRCSLFVFPSFHEGFGLPVLEAMSCGAPVIASNTTSLPELLGSKEAMFDPHDFKSIKNLIEKSLEDAKFTNFLLSNSYEQSLKFSWDNTASLVNKAINQILIKKKKKDYNLSWNLISDKNKKLLAELFIDLTQLDYKKKFYKDQLLECISASIDLINYNSDSINRLYSTTNYPNQIRVEGPFDSSYSLSILNRAFVNALSKSGYDVSLKNTEGFGDYDTNVDYLKQYSSIYSIFIQSKTHNEDCSFLCRNLYPPRVNDMDCRFNILHSYGWEESEFPKKWINDFNLNLQGITLMSNQVKKILIDNGVKLPMKVTGLGLDHILEVKSDLTFNVRAKKYKILHISSCFPRKSIDILIKSYGQAFDCNDDVTLIIKTFKNPHNKLEEILSEAREKNKFFPDVQIIYEDLNDSQIKALYLLSNVFVAPSRGEGFGLPIGEAMLLGIPVITTNWGGQIDFCDSHNSWLIDYKFSPARTHFQLQMSYWAEPSSKHLTFLLKSLYKMPIEEISKKTIIAKDNLNSHTWTNIVERNIKFFNSLRKENNLINSKIGWVTTWGIKCGISSYSYNLLSNINQKITIFTQIGQQFKINTEHINIPCWDIDINSNKGLDSLFKKIVSEGITSLVIQFNYGFFNLDEFSKLLEKLNNNHINIIIFFHSTQDPKHSNKKLFSISKYLKFCKRLLVHSIDDLNRLKEIGLVENVSLFPHGFHDFSDHIRKKSNPILSRYFYKSVVKRIATYGFCLPNKGFDKLILAIKLLRDMKANVSLTIYSAIYSEEYRYIFDELIAMTHELGVEDLVSINGQYMTDQDTLSNLSLHDLIVFPYQETSESSSASVRYGIASLRPVLVTPSPIFNDCADYLHFLRGFTPEEIAEGIYEWLYDDINSLEVYKNSLHTRISNIKELSFSRLAKRLLNMIESLEINK